METASISILYLHTYLHILISSILQSSLDLYTKSNDDLEHLQMFQLSICFVHKQTLNLSGSQSVTQGATCFIWHLVVSKESENASVYINADT